MEALVQKVDSLCEDSSTIKLAKSYLGALERWNKHRGDTDVAFACAYLASEQLQNADVIAKKAVEHTSRRGMDFWRLVADIEHALLDAAARGGPAYAPLPRHERPCKACRSGALPCLVARRTQRGRDQKVFSSKCQVCFVRKLTKCERPGAVRPRAGKGAKGGEKRRDDDASDAERSGPRALRKNTVRVNPQSAAKSSDDLPVGPPVGIRKTYGGSLSASRPPASRASTPDSDVPVLKRRGTETSGSLSAPPPKRVAFNMRRSPSPTRSPLRPSAPQSTSRGPSSSSRRPSTSARSQKVGPTEDERLWVVMTFEQALKIAQHVERHGCPVLRVRTLVEEMACDLQELSKELLETLDGDDFDAARTVVEAAVEEAAASDIADLQDVKLRVLIGKLKQRLGRFVEA
ncbi:hypothetical protein PsYK624_039920 [Phanerochaete sordida]|uniref:Uncharacterized protein n=1 Tax=Phanerochaete sordida TaxID=48140 RepID=A0A9P3LAV5_9APHY|nr:hypothetical protein PsYK624_039920 [Phanerochaete sordida]